MDIPPLLSPTLPRLHPTRTHQRHASRSPTRERFTDDILADLSPATTLEAFTNPSGKLKASIEAASPLERAFGIRATLASKKIQEWLNELTSWPWPAEGGSVGFEMLPTKGKKPLIHKWNASDRHDRHGSETPEDEEYMGSLLAEDVDRYDVRVEEITEDMEDLDVEAIKRQVLDEHFSPKSRPSSSAPNSTLSPMPSLLSSYTRMDDFTAIITATVLHALPNLSKLMRLMDVWKIRLIILKKIPPFLFAMDEAEATLRSGWDVLEKSVYDEGQDTTDGVFLLSRANLGTMQRVLQEKVTTLGRDLDYMLDTLEGREDTLPDVWLDRMEAVEQDYGEWVVSGDQKVRQGEWEKMMKARIAAAEALKLQQEQAAEEARRRVEEQAAVEARKRAEDAERIRLRLEEEQAAQEAESIQRKAEMELLESQRLEGEAARHVPLPESPAGKLSPQPSSSETISQRGEEALLTDDLELLVLDTPRPEEDTTTSDGKFFAGVATADAHLPARNESSGVIAALDEGHFTFDESAVSTALDEGHFTFDESAVSTALPGQDELNVLTTAQHPVRAHNEADSGSSSPASASALTPSDAHYLPKMTDNTETLEQSVADLTREKAAGHDMSLDKSRSADSIEDISPFSTPDSNPATPIAPTGPEAGEPAFIIDDVPSLQNIMPSYSAPQTASPSNPKRVLKLGHEVADMLRISIPEPTNESLILAQLDGNSKSSDAHSPVLEKHNEDVGLAFDKDTTRPAVTQGDWTIVNSFKGQQTGKSKSSSSGESQTSILGRKASKRHSRNVSIVNSSSFVLPAGDVTQPEQGTQFQPILPSIKSIELLASEQNSYATNPKDSDSFSGDRVSSPEINSHSIPSDLRSDLVESSTITKTSDSAGEFLSQPLSFANNSTDEVMPALDASFKFPARSNSPDPSETPRRQSVIRLETARRDSVGSDTPTVSTRWQKMIDSPNATPKVDSDELPNISEKSPTAGSIDLWISHSRSSSSPPSSPPSLETASKYGSINSPTSPTFSLSERSEASTISEAPMFEDLELQSLPPSSPKKGSHDQLQQHISSILESVPARIRLTSGPAMNDTPTLNIKKTRRSVTPSFRPSSSLGNRAGAQTPSFLLSPAYTKTPSRQRSQNTHPDIKVYHLSRSTGEAPIKLFVRLVGLNGERVMVRVGGGWADLGEYLTEYASHHGRRNKNENDKVEIQDIPRIVSSSSTASTATIRGSESGRSTPVPHSRPTSAFDRPASSLNVRKTRYSIGEGTRNEVQGFRSPSTPLPIRRSVGETTPSFITTAIRSSSRLSWTEDDIALGLAGPKGKRVTISEKDQEWVDSMKEQIKQASAEKDREKEKERRIKDRGRSFGELEKVGGTKRLFRKV